MEYKGFEIKMVPACEIAPVTYEVFGKNYATESAAKVAITKYLKQQEQAAVEAAKMVNDVLQEIANFYLDNSVIPSRNKREGRFVGVTNGKVCRYRASDWRGYQGQMKVFSASYEPKNRKQRKAAKLAWWKQVDEFCDKLFG